MKVPREVLIFELPLGYELYEDSDFLYIKCGEETIATLPIASATPSAILKIIKEHQQKSSG